MDIPSCQELEEFLKKVDQVESIVKGLNSDDKNLIKENLDKADRLIDDRVLEVDDTRTKTISSRTVINKYSEDDQNIKISQQPNINQDAFLAALEQDAQERYERKKKMTKLANELKEKGNKEFKEKNYEKAIEYYTQALQNVRDIPVIYTNRAQAFNAVGKFQEAIEDCDWALKIDEKYIKAMIHKGKALGFMKNFDQALVEFENAKIIDPKQSCLIDDYVKEVERNRLAFNQEKAAEVFLSENNTENSSTNNIIDILNKKINIVDQTNWYYSGGLRCLASLCNDEMTRTLFRTQNGFSLFINHPVFSKYFQSEIKIINLDSSEIDLLCSLFEFFKTIITECDENIRAIFNLKNFNKIIENFVKQLKKNSSLKSTITDFMLKLSENDFGITQVINNFDHFGLIDSLIDLIEKKNISYNDHKIVNVVQNFFLEEKFQIKLTVENAISFINKLISILKEQSELNKNNVHFVCQIFTSIHALTSQKKFLVLIKDLNGVWNEATKFLILANGESKDHDILFNALVCLLNNLSAFKSEHLDSNFEKIFNNVTKENYCQNQQVLKLVANIIQNTSLHNEIFSKNFIENLIKNVKTKTALNQSIKILALLTQNSFKNYRKYLTQFDKNLEFLYEIFKNVSETSDQKISNNNRNLNLKKLDEKLISNAVLCMSNCVESDDNLVHNLLKTNIIMDLLYLTRDGYNANLQKNCGILIAKLAKKDQRHLVRLRELNGVEILYSALKNVNI